MNRTQKAEVVDQLREQLQSAKSVVLTSYQGIEVNIMNDLRAQFRKEGVEYHVVKNTLVRRAIADTPMEVMAEHFKGPVAIAYSTEDAITPAKLIKDFAKDHKEKFVVKGAFLDGEMLDQAGVQQLADRPSKDELRVQFLLTLQAGPTQFIRTLSAGPQALLMVFQAKQMAEEG
jgi:large subunit ribosomal protein L10